MGHYQSSGISNSVDGQGIPSYTRDSVFNHLPQVCKRDWLWSQDAGGLAHAAGAPHTIPAHSTRWDHHPLPGSTSRAVDPAPCKGHNWSYTSVVPTHTWILERMPRQSYTKRSEVRPPENWKRGLRSHFVPHSHLCCVVRLIDRAQVYDIEW